MYIDILVDMSIDSGYYKHMYFLTPPAEKAEKQHRPIATRTPALRSGVLTPFRDAGLLGEVAASTSRTGNTQDERGASQRV